MNAPALRDRSWVHQVNKYVARAPKSFWFFQAQFDLGLGSIFGDNNSVTDMWNPFLHYKNTEQELTIGYGGLTEGAVKFSTREEREKWTTWM